MEKTITKTVKLKEVVADMFILRGKNRCEKKYYTYIYIRICEM